MTTSMVRMSHFQKPNLSYQKWNFSNRNKNHCNHNQIWAKYDRTYTQKAQPLWLEKKKKSKHTNKGNGQRGEKSHLVLLISFSAADRRWGILNGSSCGKGLKYSCQPFKKGSTNISFSHTHSFRDKYKKVDKRKKISLFWHCEYKCYHYVFTAI